MLEFLNGLNFLIVEIKGFVIRSLDECDRVKSEIESRFKYLAFEKIIKK